MVTEGFDPSSNNHESLQPSCSSFHLSLNRSGIVDSDLHLGSESGGGYPSQDIWYEYLHDQKDTSKYIIIWSQKQVRHVAWLWCIYLDNPSVQNYRSKSETAIIIAGCLNFRSFQFFSPFQFPHFGLLIFVRRFVGFFRRFVGFFRRFKTGKHMQHEKHAKSVRRQKKMPPAIILEKAIILHTLEDAGMYGSMYVVMYLCLHVRMDGWLYGWMDVCIYVIYVFMYSNHPPNKKENTNQ